MFFFLTGRAKEVNGKGGENRLIYKKRVRQRQTQTQTQTQTDRQINRQRQRENELRESKGIQNISPSTLKLFSALMLHCTRMRLKCNFHLYLSFTF